MILDAVETIHECKAEHVQSVPLQEMLGDVPVWQGVVEVFSLTGHPKAKRCYAWRAIAPGDKDFHFTAVLEIPPVKDARTAVQASIMARKADRGRL